MILGIKKLILVYVNIIVCRCKLVWYFVSTSFMLQLITFFVIPVISFWLFLYFFSSQVGQMLHSHPSKVHSPLAVYRWEHIPLFPPLLSLITASWGGSKEISSPFLTKLPKNEGSSPLYLSSVYAKCYLDALSLFRLTDCTKCSPPTVAKDRIRK